MRSRSRRYVAAKAEHENKIEFQLIQAIYQNDEAAFNLLINSIDCIDSGITKKSKWSPLMFAVHKKRTKFVAKLLEMGANPNCIDHSTKKSCLHTACTFGYGDIALLLLETGKVSNINSNENEEGESPLFAAIKKLHKFCVELLLNDSLHSQICDINVKLNTNGQSPIFIACDKGDVEIVKLLINYKYLKCDINCQDNKGYTPLMKAVGKNHINVVELLLNKNKNINPLEIPNLNLTNNLKQCVTMIAVRTNNFKMTKILLNVDDIDINNNNVLYRRDYRQRTILDLAQKYHSDKRIIQFIKKLLYKNIHSIIENINNNKEYEIIPYVPHGVVQYICNMTY